MNRFKSKEIHMILLWLFTAIAIIIGVVIRFKGLAVWPLALDEYYIIKSSENILKYGLPQFPNGGYYERGLLMQYLIAPLLAVGVKAEFAGRIFPLLSNLVAIPAVFLIAKRAGNSVVAALAVVIFSLSIWEIEFARFARMYAPFQAVTIWYFYFALKDYENRNLNNFKWLLVLSVISIFLYEGSIFLSLFNFVPFVILKKFDLKLTITSAAIFIFSVFYNTFSFITIKAAPVFPKLYLDFASKIETDLPIKLPRILLPISFQNEYFTFLSLVILTITILLIIIIIKNNSPKNIFKLSSIIILGLCAVLNQFGLFILLFLMLYLWNVFNAEFLTRKNLLLFAAIFIINLTYWYGYGILNKDWFVLFSDFSSYSIWGVTKRLLTGFFEYPENYITFTNYFRVVPLLTVFSGFILFVFFILLYQKKVNNDRISFLFGAVIFMGLSAGIPNTLYDETRYTFFIVPIFTIVVLFSIHLILTQLFRNSKVINGGFVILTLLIFALSKDFNFHHLINIDDKTINYRMHYDKFYKKHIYRRWDIKTPTDYVKQHLKENDLIMINENSQEYYLPKVDYFNFDFKHVAFVALSVEHGTKERWSNAKLIYSNEDLINFIENRKNTVWFLVYPENWLNRINFYERYGKYLVYQGIDDMIKVFRFPVGKE